MVILNLLFILRTLVERGTLLGAAVAQIVVRRPITEGFSVQILFALSLLCPCCVSIVPRIAQTLILLENFIMTHLHLTLHKVVF